MMVRLVIVVMLVVDMILVRWFVLMILILVAFSFVVGSCIWGLMKEQVEMVERVVLRSVQVEVLCTEDDIAVCWCQCQCQCSRVCNYLSSFLEAQKRGP